jgi:hypothetical protein
MTPHGAALRILVAVQPAVLQDALVQVLNSAGLDQVETLDVELDTTERGLTGYDAAVVSELAPPGIRARVVITLPDQFGSPGLGAVEAAGQGAWPVPLASSADVIALLDRLVPAQTPRL